MTTKPTLVLLLVALAMAAVASPPVAAKVQCFSVQEGGVCVAATDQGSMRFLCTDNGFCAASINCPPGFYCYT